MKRYGQYLFALALFGSVVDVADSAEPSTRHVGGPDAIALKRLGDLKAQGLVVVSVVRGVIHVQNQCGPNEVNDQRPHAREDALRLIMKAVENGSSAPDVPPVKTDPSKCMTKQGGNPGP